jgi:hypothetical protein
MPLIKVKLLNSTCESDEFGPNDTITVNHNFTNP